MALGPLTIFDKSFLQSLNPDESALFDNFFRTLITPLFFVETLADLDMEVARGKTPEQVVGEIAYKSPEMNSIPNVHHFNLLVSNLMGYPVEGDRRPVIAGGIPKEAEGGGFGLFFKEFPEFEALQRWQSGKFAEAEREFAKGWRNALKNPGFESSIAMVGNIVPPKQKLSNMEDVKAFIDSFLETATSDQLVLLFELLDIPSTARPRILQRWELEGKPILKRFAPYACYVFTVDLFFYLCLGRGFIAKERASNKADIAYLYYLPFAHIFISNDKLHKKTVPLFLEADQQFIDGADIKPELHILNAYYETLPEEVKQQGLIRFAPYPPKKLISKIHELWDRYLPIWREHEVEYHKEPLSAMNSDSKLLDYLKSTETAPVYTGEGPISSDEAHHVTLTRFIRSRKGQWRTIPKEVEEKAQEKG